MMTSTSRGTARPSPAARAHALIATASLLLACGGGGATGDGPTGTGTESVVTLADLAPATVAVGGVVPRILTITVVSGSAGPLQWTSDNPAVATVDRLGTTSAAEVKGIAPGTATIRAAVGSASMSAAVTVRSLSFNRLVLNGGRHACGRLADDSWQCWGDHGEHALGPITDAEICPDQMRPCSTTPRPVIAPSPFTSMAVSHGGQTCGLTADGSAHCWGNNYVDMIGTSSEICTVPEVNPFPCVTTPTPVRGNVKFASLHLGGSFCGLTAQSEAYCWGPNDLGQLGDGTTTLRVTPGPVSGGLTFSTLGVGAGHACGLTVTGKAYCWGWNRVGQLGDGTTTDRTTPVAVAGGLTFVSITAAREHTCGVATGGAVYCWGENKFGQLGDGTTTNSAVPKQISGSTSFLTVTAGLEHTCALSTTNRAYCWGQNRSAPFLQGMLGDGTTTPRPTAAPVARDLPFLELKAGRAFTCGRTPDGKIYCWGDNRFGQLGAGMTGAQFTTTPVGVAGVP